MTFFDIKQIHALSSEITARSTQLFNRPRYKEDLIKIQLNIASVFIREKEYEYGLDQLKVCTELVESVPYITVKNRLNYLKGLYLIHTGKEKLGLEMAKKAIQLYTDFGFYDRSQLLTEELNLLLNRS